MCYNIITYNASLDGRFVAQRICYLEGESTWNSLVHLEGVVSMIIKDCCCNLGGCIIYTNKIISKLIYLI